MPTFHLRLSNEITLDFPRKQTDEDPRLRQNANG